MTRKKGKGYFSISAVAKMFSVHQQTIRMYEKEGLISPKRSEGNTRLFSPDDIDRLEEIIYLTHTLGINLAGVEMILKLQKHIKKLQKEMNELFKQARQELAKEAEFSKTLIEKSSQHLIQLRYGKKKQKKKSEQTTSEHLPPALEDSCQQGDTPVHSLVIAQPTKEKSME
jgi:MerR family transcriptional regulator, heat shock protein HspR